MKLLLFAVTLFLGLFFVNSIGAQQNTWSIDGGKVYMDDSKAYISAEPHTIYGSDAVTFTISPKQYTGEVDVVFLANDAIKPVYARYYDPHYEQSTHSYTCAGDFDYTLNPNHFWCYSPVLVNGSGGDLIYEHSFDTGDIETKTAYWSTPHSVEWRDIGSTFDRYDIDYDGFKNAFVRKGIHMEAGQTYVMEVGLEVAFRSGYDKYGFAVKPSSETMLQAISNGHLYYLDPWVNATFSGHYPINSSMGVGKGFAINDTGKIGGVTTIWTFNDSNLAVYCENEGCATGSFAVGDDSGEVPWHRDDNSLGYSPSNVFNASTVLHFTSDGHNSAPSGDTPPTEVVGSVVYNSTAVYGNAIHLTQSDNQVIHVKYNMSAANPPGWTFMGWFKINAFAAETTLAHCSDSGQLEGWRARLQENPPGSMQITFRSLPAGDMLSGGIAINQWVHIAIVQDAANQRIYFNGTQDSSQVDTTTNAFNNLMAIGGWAYDNSTRASKISVDEFRLYERALTPAEIYQHYINGKTEIMSNLAAWEAAAPAAAAPTNMTLYINGSEANKTVTYDTDDNLNLTGVINVTGITPIIIERNGTQLASGTTRVEFDAPRGKEFPARYTYNITASWAGNATYSASSATLWVTANPLNHAVTLLLNSSAANFTLNYPTSLFVQWNSIPGGSYGADFYFNDTLKGNWPTSSLTLTYREWTSGQYNLTAAEQSINYTANPPVSLWVTVLKANANLTMTANGTAGDITILNNSALNLTMTTDLWPTEGNNFTLTSNYTGWQDVNSTTTLYNYTTLRTTTLGSEYNFTAYYTSPNATGSVTRHVTIDDVEVTDNRYESQVYSGSTQRFNVTFRVPSGINDLEAVFWYNGTAYANTSSTRNSTHMTLYTSLVPNITGTVELVNLTWRYYYADRVENTTNVTQTIYRPGLFDCSATIDTVAYTIKALNETNPFALIPNTTMNMYFRFTIGSTLYEYNASNTTDIHYICIFPANATAIVDASLDYDAGGYSKRTYFLINDVATNVSKNVGLYLLADSLSTSTEFLLRDSFSASLPNHYIKVNRTYFELGNEERTVFVMKTDENGVTNAPMVSKEVFYRYTINDGIIDIYTTDLNLVTDNPTIIALPADTVINYYEYYDNIAYGCSYSDTTRNLTCNVVDSLGAVGNMESSNLKVWYKGSAADIKLCDDTLTANSNTHVCTIAGDYNGTLLYSLSVSLSDEMDFRVLDQQFFTAGGSSSIFGVFGMFMAFILVATMAFIGTSMNMTIGLLLPVITIGLLVSFGMLNGLWDFALSIFFAGAIILYTRRRTS